MLATISQKPKQFQVKLGWPELTTWSGQFLYLGLITMTYDGFSWSYQFQIGLEIQWTMSLAIVTGLHLKMNKTQKYNQVG
jgi:hypothetical protein